MLLLYFMLLRTPLEKRWVHLKLLIPNKENKNMWTRRRLWRFDAFETVELVEEVVRARGGAVTQPPEMHKRNKRK